LRLTGVTSKEGLIALAGYFRILSPQFGRPLSQQDHERAPSTAPAFPGLDAQNAHWKHGVKVSGATVHFVATEVDAGPIILQAHVPIRDDDTVETLSERIVRRSTGSTRNNRLFTEEQ